MTAAAESRAAEASLEQRMNRGRGAPGPVRARRRSPGGSRPCRSPPGNRYRSGGTVAVVIPEGAQLEAELLAPSSAAGFIRPGQDTRLMLQAFPHQRFGTVKGAIKTISRTVLGPTEISIPGLKIDEPVFRVRVSPGAREHRRLWRGDPAAARHAADRRRGVRPALADPMVVRSPVRGGTTVMNLPATHSIFHAHRACRWCWRARSRNAGLPASP